MTEQFGVESFQAANVWHEAHGPVPDATEASIGIVGGGPAGLAAAYGLRLAGHPVTIYEANDRMGGMMVLGIPEYRLARELIAREIEAIVDLGIEVRTSTRVGIEVTIDDLLARHAALFVGVGTGRGRDLALPGSDQDGILRAVEFLLNVNQGYQVSLGERVVVVGGGNVAFDAARTALRAAAGAGSPEGADDDRPDQVGTAEDARRAMTTTLDVARAAVREGVLDVTVIALESPEEIPADPEEIAEAEAEGITILYRRGPHRFVGEDGKVTGLETIAVRSVFDADGRFNPTFDDGTEDVLPADTIILAVGQATDVGFLGDLALDRTPAGGLRVDPGTLRTSHPSVWAGGDVAKGPRNLIDAIADGLRAAESIHAATSDSTETPAARSTAVRVELTQRPGFRRLSTGVRRHRTRAGARHPQPAAGGLRRGRGRLRRAGRVARVAPLPAVLRQRHARAGPLHPLRPVRRRVPHGLHHHRPGRPSGSGGRVAERAAARRGPVHPLRPVREPVPAGRAVDGARARRHRPAELGRGGGW